ncbi:hypothetical protein A8E95_16165 [Burkholderia cenocepacia]|nr:hypothetical protein A8E96_23350 [Burkholderia cenocepacia]ONW32307.1 hypothetical protein A8E95_16165 [Burkholderia cenocepacia]
MQLGSIEQQSEDRFRRIAMNQVHGFDVLDTDRAMKKLPRLPTRRTKLNFKLADQFIQVCSFGSCEQPPLTIVVVDDVSSSNAVCNFSDRDRLVVDMYIVGLDCLSYRAIEFLPRV